VENWAEIRRLHRAEGMPIKAIVRATGYQRSASASSSGSTGPPAVWTGRLARMNEYPYTWSALPSSARASWSLGMVRRLRARGSAQGSGVFPACSDSQAVSPWR
jgi:hypothetical protein